MLEGGDSTPSAEGAAAISGGVKRTDDPSLGKDDDQGTGDSNLSKDGAIFESIRRRRSGSNKRNYRQTTGIDAASSDDDEEPKSASSRLDEPGEGTQPKGAEIMETVPGTSSTLLASTGNEQTLVPNLQDEDMSRDSITDMHVLENSPSPLPMMPGTPSSDDSNFLDHREPRLAFYPGGVEIEGSNMSSSSSSSLDFMQDEDDLEEDDTSESSDSLDDLDDLQDRPIEVRTNRNFSPDPLSENPTKKQLSEKEKNKNGRPIPKVLQKPKPKCAWNGPKEILKREMGLRTRIQAQSAEIFRSKFYGSLFSAERLELMIKLDGHDGCVNCLNFNYAGTKLASGSDDLEIKIWDYGVGKLITSFNSQHRSNVFQAKFMPLIGLDNIIVTCARDSQVRLTELDSSGVVATSRKLAQHRGPVHKLAINPETPHIVLTCGEDGVVYNCDIRENKSQKILSLVENGRKVALYSIHTNPILSHEFCVVGRDEYVRIYDTRKLSRSSVSSANNSSSSQAQTENPSTSTENTTVPLKRFCPHHLQGHKSKPHITAAVYNYNGTEIVASYNDENIYLFDASHSDLADYINVYEGHLNSATVKGVNFYGDKSQFIVSGSDCSHIFIWDKKTESIVNFFRGDEKGVVNCLEPHPTAPILATSGLDDDVKIWIPSSETAPKMGDLAATVRRNIKKRDEEMESRPNALDSQIMWQLIHHLHREQRRNRRTTGEEVESDSSSEEDDEAADSSSRGVECAIA